MGKRFDKVCFCWPIRVYNPKGMELEYAKKLVLVIKTIITDLAAKSKE